ncbi:hypothetical protein LSAT2_007820, partial [Lamellibrachia satsuma]
RSSSCSRVNCVWRDWSGWRACNHPCGTAGTQSRSRGIATGASCGGSSCSGPSNQTRACNRYCDNGGTPQFGHCDCPDEFWGTCCDKRHIYNVVGVAVGDRIGTFPVSVVIEVVIGSLRSRGSSRGQPLNLGSVRGQ